MSLLAEPFAYRYMIDAIWVSALIGGLCGFLSCYLMLRGWSLIGDALSHAVVPGVAVAGLLGLPFAVGAFVAGGLAAASMLALQGRSGLKSDVVIGLTLTAFLGLGLFLISVRPMAVSIQSIVMGNIMAITPGDTIQLMLIGGLSLAVLLIRWRDLLAVFFDETHARSIGLRPARLRALFLALLSASVVAGMQTVGAFLVIALVVTPGATAFLLTDRFPRLLALGSGIGAGTSAAGAYLSYYLDGATGGVIVLLQTLLFALAFVLAPTHGLLAARTRARAAARQALP